MLVSMLYNLDHMLVSMLYELPEDVMSDLKYNYYLKTSTSHLGHKSFFIIGRQMRTKIFLHMALVLNSY